MDESSSAHIVDMLNNTHSSFSIAIFSVWICDFSWLPSFVVTDAAITCGEIGQIRNTPGAAAGCAGEYCTGQEARHTVLHSFLVHRS